VRDATASGPTSLQAPYLPPFDRILPSSIVDGREYLNVNVWTPDPGGGGLPVMVWIHGGAFVRGANSISIYDGSAFARDGIVLVGVNYRLGLAGFGVLPDAPANLGLLDQVLALRWVQENIAAFGGDPANVTIFGESAGGMSVATLLSAPEARGLYSKAIVQSGGGGAVADVDDARKVTVAVATELGVAATAEGLTAVEPAALLDAQTAVGLAVATNPDPDRWGASLIRGGLGIMSYFPCVDGGLVPGTPVDMIATGASAGIPLLVGTTAEEFRLFTVPTGVAGAITPEMVPQATAKYGWDAGAAEVYSANRPGASPGDVVTAMLTDAAFRVPAVRLAEAQQSTGAPVHVYEFSWRTKKSDLGACHALELPFVFDTLAAPDGRPLTGPDAPQELATEMHGAWVAFARDGDPGWRRYTPDDRAVMTFDDAASRVVQDPRADELARWPVGPRPAGTL
jgi:para-nitrobenzyl esterase